MTKLARRERVLRAIELCEPDFVPFDCGLTVEPYRALIDYLGLPSEEPLRPNQWLELRPSPALADALDLDICYLEIGSPFGSPSFTFGMDSFTNEWGMNFKKVLQPSGQFYYELYDPPLADATVDDLAAYAWPDPNDPGWTEDLANRARLLRESSDRAIIMEQPISIFEHAYMLRGFQQFLLDMAINPGFAAALMDRCCDIAITVVCAALREAGQYVDVVKHLDDMGAQYAPLMSPKMFQEMILPRFERLFQAIKSEFAKCNPRGKIMAHTDGDVYPFIEGYIVAGINVLNSVQPKVAGMDHQRLKRQFGNRIALHGGVDVQYTMPSGTPEDVAEEARQRIKDLASGGGYILAPSHNLQHDVPPENVVALRDAVRRYGRYPL